MGLCDFVFTFVLKVFELISFVCLLLQVACGCRVLCTCWFVLVVCYCSVDYFVF